MVALCSPPHVEHWCLPEHSCRESQLRGRWGGAQGRPWLNAAQVGSPPPPPAACADREGSCWQVTGEGMGWEAGMDGAVGSFGRELVMRWRRCWRTRFVISWSNLLCIKGTREVISCRFARPQVVSDKGGTYDSFLASSARKIPTSTSWSNTWLTKSVASPSLM